MLAEKKKDQLHQYDDVCSVATPDPSNVRAVSPCAEALCESPIMLSTVVIPCAAAPTPATVDSSTNDSSTAPVFAPAAEATSQQPAARPSALSICPPWFAERSFQTLFDLMLLRKAGTITPEQTAQLKELYSQYKRAQAEAEANAKTKGANAEGAKTKGTGSSADANAASSSTAAEPTDASGSTMCDGEVSSPSGPEQCLWR